MAYGIFNVGGGASNFDLDALAGSLIADCVTASLATADDVEIATRDGKPIFAYAIRARPECGYEQAIASAVAGVVRMVESWRGENLTQIYSLAADIIRGDVSAPLLAVNGELLCCANGEVILSHMVRENNGDYANSIAAKAVLELSATVERYQAQNLAAIQDLVVGLMSGQFAAQMADTQGTGITSQFGEPVVAVKKV